MSVIWYIANGWNPSPNLFVILVTRSMMSLFLFPSQCVQWEVSYHPENYWGQNDNFPILAEVWSMIIGDECSHDKVGSNSMTPISSLAIVPPLGKSRCFSHPPIAFTDSPMASFGVRSICTIPFPLCGLLTPLTFSNFVLDNVESSPHSPFEGFVWLKVIYFVLGWDIWVVRALMRKS